MDKKRVGIALLLVCGMTVTAFADDDSSTNATANSAKTNVTQAVANESLYQQLKKTLDFEYFGIYRGASLTDLGNSAQPDTNGNPDAAGTGTQGVETYLTTGYKFAPDAVAGITWHFMNNVAPQGATAGQTAPSGMEWLDPMLMVSKAKLIHSGNFSLKGYMYATLPTSTYDYISAPGRNMITELSPTVNMTYDIPGTRWTIGDYAYIGAYIPGPNTPDGLRTYKLYDAPYLNYQATPRLAATLWVDLIQDTRVQGTPFITGMSNPEADIEPGVAYDLIPGQLTINPVLNIYPGSASLASTSIQAVIIGKLF